MTHDWLHIDGNGVILTLHVQPGAKQTEVVGTHGDALKIRLAAPPVDGKANDTLLAFLADTLGIRKSAITLVSGHAARRKRVHIQSVSSADVVARLNQP